ncbi:hypothetical protein M407DRAFT_53258, partial [Tulasnella calospora MUT 4182]
EVGLLSQISHPNVIEFIGFVEELDSQIAWILTPMAMHGNVRNFLASGTWRLVHRISLLWDIASGVEYLHTYRPPIIHGDLKSINVVVNEEGHAEIIDFGSARFAEYVDENLYTLRWASPETLENDVVSLASDIWSLGWTFWEVVTGRVPHENQRDVQVIMTVITESAPKWADADELQIQTLRDLLMDCWQRDPERRPTASQCCGALR